MNKVKSLTWPELVLLFGVPTILDLIACKIAIPFLQSTRVFPIEISYFLSVGILVLVPKFSSNFTPQIIINDVVQI